MTWIEEKLRNISRIQISPFKKVRMKMRILASMKRNHAVAPDFGYSGLMSRIRREALGISPRGMFRAFLKEKLYETPLPGWSFQRFFSSGGATYRRIFAAITAAIFLFVFVIPFPFRIHVAEASSMTFFENIEGDVTVIRGSQEIRGAPHFILNANDVIRTGSQSKAVIRYLDQSVGRLAEDSEMKISRLFFNPSNRTETVVEVVLHQGRLWTRVVNLVDSLSRFQVKAKNGMVVAKRKAAFDVSISDQGKTKFSAIQNRVDLTVATDNKVIETTLMKGNTAELNANTTSAPRIREETKTTKNDSWVTSNLVEDKAYIENLKKETNETMENESGMLPGNPFYAMKSISETTQIALTLNDVDRQKKILATAEEKLVSAEVLTNRGDLTTASVLLREFSDYIAQVTAWIQKYQSSHPAEAQEVKNYARALLRRQKKQLALALPKDPLYRVKEIISQAQMLIASTPTEKTEEKISQAGNKLLEAHDLAEQGDSVSAQQQIQEYSKTITEVVTEVKQLPTDEKGKAVSALLDSKVEDLKDLGTIVAAPAAEPLAAHAPLPDASNIVGTTVLFSAPMFPKFPVQPSPPAPEMQPLEKTISEAKVDTLTQVGEAILEVQHEEPSTEVQKKVENMKNIDVNGKPMMNMTLSKGRLTITSDGNFIQVTPQKLNLKFPELLPTKP